MQRQRTKVPAFAITTPWRQLQPAAISCHDPEVSGLSIDEFFLALFLDFFRNTPGGVLVQERADISGRPLPGIHPSPADCLRLANDQAKSYGESPHRSRPAVIGPRIRLDCLFNQIHE